MTIFFLLLFVLLNICYITLCTKIIVEFLILLLHFIIAVPLPSDYSSSKEESKGLIAYKRMAATDIYSKLKRLLKITKRILKFKFLTKRKKVEIYKDSDDETLDWWSKYFASLQVCKTTLNVKNKYCRNYFLLLCTKNSLTQIEELLIFEVKNFKFKIHSLS